METNRNDLALKAQTAKPVNGSQSANALQSDALVENRLEALTMLCNSLLREVDAIKKSKNAKLPQKIDLAGEVARFEKDLIRCTLIRTGGRQRQAARLLHVKVTTLNAKIKRYGITLSNLFQDSE